MLHRFMVWQRLKRRSSTNTADDMRGELKPACRRDVRDITSHSSFVAQQKMTKAPSQHVNQHFNFNHRPSLHQANTYNPRPAKFFYKLNTLSLDTT
jgi:hypothetical protein